MLTNTLVIAYYCKEKIITIPATFRACYWLLMW